MSDDHIHFIFGQIIIGNIMTLYVEVSQVRVTSNKRPEYKTKDGADLV